VDDVLFTRLPIYTTKGDDKRLHGRSDGVRVIHTTPNPAYYAKSRPTLPSTLPLSWRAYMEARASVDPLRTDGEVTGLRRRIDELLDVLGDQAATNDTSRWVDAAPNDVSRLREVVNVLTSEVEKKGRAA